MVATSAGLLRISSVSLAALEDARDALVDSSHLGVVLRVEDQIRQVSRKLDFDDPKGPADA